MNIYSWLIHIVDTSFFLTNTYQWITLVQTDQSAKREREREFRELDSMFQPIWEREREREEEEEEKEEEEKEIYRVLNFTVK